MWDSVFEGRICNLEVRNFYLAGGQTKKAPVICLEVETLGMDQPAWLSRTAP